MSHSPSADEEAELTELKDKIFHAIGRNLVTLQHMETMLRTMCTHSAYGGPTSDPEQLLRERRRKLSKAGFGSLADKFAGEVLAAPQSGKDDLPDDVQEPHFRIRFFLGQDALIVKERMRALRRVVTMRNALVHKLHRAWDSRSVESGLRLLERLSAEHQQAMVEHASLRKELRVMRRAMLMQIAFMQAPEFQSLIGVGIDGGNLKSDAD